MASVLLENVTKVYEGRVRAVSDLTLEVREGELMVLVGPSGCGKTTILRLIAGLERITSGRIRIAGRVVNDVSPRDRDVAMVFQDGALYPHMSVYDNLAFPLRMKKRGGADRKHRVATVAETLGIADLLKRKPASLSGGQRQRVALGRAMVREPALFLFDEPLTSLDAQLRSTMRAEVKALHQKFRTTTLYVTHDQSEAMALGERLCVLRDGRVQQVGRPDEVYDRPANTFVAGFFGVPAMNFLHGRVRFKEETAYVDVGTGEVRVPPTLQPCLTAYGEETVVVGIRPHDLSLTPGSAGMDNVFSGRVILIEPLGFYMEVHVRRPPGDTCVLAVRARADVGVGDEVAVRIDCEKLHFFEAGESGRNIASGVTSGS